MKTIFKLLALMVFLTGQSCIRKEADKKTITQRIQYDVTIKSPDPGFDWWVQNIEGMNREALINDLLEAAYSGKVRAYDAFSFHEVSPEQIKSIGSRRDTLRMQNPVPPYQFYDTVIIKELSIHDITRIRFLEKWKLNSRSMQISKEVLGMAPMLESYDEHGILRGYQPMFWIFFDDRYPGPLR